VGEEDCGPKEYPWIEGPHENFAAQGPEQLAHESLRWFEHSDDAAVWRENPSARLELVYPGEALTITARYSPGLDLSWEEQLRDWFARFPPGSGGVSEPGESGAEQYHWTVDFGERGRIDGIVASEATAIERLKSLGQDGGSSPILRQYAWSLCCLVRRSSHVMDCYSVDTDDLAELDELPVRLREKRERYARN